MAISCRATFTFVTIFLLFSSVSTSPFDGVQPEKQTVLSPNSDCLNITTFTPDWFLQNTKQSFRREFIDKAVFYTRGAGERARKLACSDPWKYVTIWDIWPSELYDSSNHVSNKLRCIHNSKNTQRNFFENMSSAYAQMARSHAYVMHTLSDFASPPMEGIWGRIELDVLTQRTDVSELWKQSDDQSLKETIEISRKPAKHVLVSAMERVGELWGQAMGDGQKLRGRSLEEEEEEEETASCRLWDAKVMKELDALF
ncbi:uncharacterized protein MYCFIDRAFT_199331 [Pseudocercospora fijiensis CIRAD86]|uniref:Uncharacterized protein n=1 Tax=Pseudocercospora fijiensis (strain CIRAD86) TaxID=383855 RepID=M2YPE3_PSEFD|nr:uncharacterized protein MYCFIDRAFT_199331 [Pseudocercospora fijiensis CIRAD86]EME79625.1 hypothetical protein MYCFIDRAFT_199331 [Pseudocercospora fijiensis CIRAD86]